MSSPESDSHFLRKLLFVACVAGFCNNALHSQSLDHAKTDHVPRSMIDRSARETSNLARWHRGATLVLVHDKQFFRIQVQDVGDFEESIFLSDNDALEYEIGTGKQDFIVDLGQQAHVSRFFLNNQSAAGTLSLFVSDEFGNFDTTKWSPLRDTVEFSKGVIPSIELPETSTRYLLVRIDVTKSGKIGNFGVTGRL